MRFALLVSALFTAQAYACPQLTGTYTCTYQDGSTETVAITQTVQNGVTMYNYNNSTIPADNKTYNIPDDETLKEGTFRAWCDDAVTLKTELMGKYYSEGSYFGDLKMNLNITADATGLKQVTVGSLKNTGGEYPLNSDLTCNRIN